MLLKSSIFDSQSFILHKNGIEFHQEWNGSIHTYIHDLVRHCRMSYSTVDIVLNSLNSSKGTYGGGAGNFPIVILLQVNNSALDCSNNQLLGD